MANNEKLTINKLKIELGQDILKEMILDYYLGKEPKVEYDNYESYFYLAEDGSPMFVVEQKS